MNNYLKILILLMFLMFSCSTTRMVTLTSVVRYPSTKKPVLSISNMTVNSPNKGQQLFTFEDFTSFAYSGYESFIDAFLDYKEGKERRKKLFVVDSLHRGNFQYYLSHDTDSLFRRALSNVFEMSNDSPLRAHVKADFKYFLPERGNIKNELGIYLSLKLSIMKDSVNVFTNSYESTLSEEYSTALVTYPRNDNMNSLFYYVLRDIVEQIYTDNGLKEIKIIQ